MSILEEKTLSEELKFQGRIFDVYVKKVSLPNGETSFRELVMHHGGVGILPVDEEENIYLVSQYRKAYEEDVTEVPAGKLELNEPHEEAARRELLEETGFVSYNMEYAGKIYPSPGYVNEVIHLYIARELEYKGQQLDNGEFLNVRKVSYEKAMEMIENGEITDSKTVVLILKYGNLRQK